MSEFPTACFRFDDLVGALLMHWHTRLDARLEQTLVTQPVDIETVVIAGWRTCASRLAGVRLILDTFADQRLSPR